jgi:hypothetical protein
MVWLVSGLLAWTGASSFAELGYVTLGTTRLSPTKLYPQIEYTSERGSSSISGIRVRAPRIIPLRLDGHLCTKTRLVDLLPLGLYPVLTPSILRASLPRNTQAATRSSASFSPNT